MCSNVTLILQYLLVSIRLQHQKKVSIVDSRSTNTVQSIGCWRDGKTIFTCTASEPTTHIRNIITKKRSRKHERAQCAIRDNTHTSNLTIRCIILLIYRIKRYSYSFIIFFRRTAGEPILGQLKRSQCRQRAGQRVILIIIDCYYFHSGRARCTLFYPRISISFETKFVEMYLLETRR